MAEKGIRIKNGGIILDEDNEKITLFCGKSSIVIDGNKNKIALNGPVSKMNKGDETEEIFLQKTSAITALIPSSTFTPIPQAIPNIPIQEVQGMLKDVILLTSLFVGLK